MLSGKIAFITGANGGFGKSIIESGFDNPKKLYFNIGDFKSKLWHYSGGFPVFHVFTTYNNCMSSPVRVYLKCLSTYDYKKKITPLSVNFIDNFSIHVSDIYTNTYKTLSYLSSNYDFHTIVFLQPTRGHYSLKKNCWIKRNNGTSTFYFTEVKNEQKNWERLDLFYKILYVPLFI